MKDCVDIQPANSKLPLELRGGKFFRGNDPVPLEFGNLEQIRLMNEQIRERHELETEGIPVDPTFTVTIEAEIQFKCECGSWVYVTVEPDDEDDIDCFVGETRTCRGCKKNYEVRKDDEGELRVKPKK